MNPKGVVLTMLVERNKQPESVNKEQQIEPIQSEIWTPTEEREIECFIASIEFELDENDEFALKVKNEDPEQYELIMRIATGEMVPDRFCKFDKSSLENFAKDSEKGVPMMQSHNTYRDVGIGYTFLGEYVASKKHVNAAAYIIKGLNLNSGYTYSNTNDYVLALERKGIREVSMGISGGTAICSICGGNYMSYRECQHWSGKEYPVGPSRTMKLCFYTWHDSHLDEVSFVANGAVPGAVIMKAQQMLEKGEIELQDISKVYEKRYKNLNVTETFINKRIPYNILNSGDAVTTTEEESSESTIEENSEMDLTATITSLQAAHPNLNIPDDPAEALNTLATGYSASKATVETQQTQLTQLQEQNGKLQLAANDGQAYREEWRKAAEDAHVARFGQPLGDVYVSLFDNESTPASEIKKYAEKWQEELQSANGGSTQTQTQTAGGPKAKTIEGNQQGQGSTAVLLPKVRPIG